MQHHGEGDRVIFGGGGGGGEGTCSTTAREIA